MVFNSNATNLLADPSPSGMIYVRDMVEKTTTMVSVDNEGNPAADYCHRPVISGNGRYVTFYTEAALVPEDTNGKWDVYVRDLQEGTTTLVSQNAAGTNSGNNGSLTRCSASTAPALSRPGLPTWLRVGRPRHTSRSTSATS